MHYFNSMQVMTGLFLFKYGGGLLTSYALFRMPDSFVEVYRGKVLFTVFLIYAASIVCTSKMQFPFNFQREGSRHFLVQLGRSFYLYIAHVAHMLLF